MPEYGIVKQGRAEGGGTRNEGRICMAIGGGGDVRHARSENREVRLAGGRTDRLPV